MTFQRSNVRALLTGLVVVVASLAPADEPAKLPRVPAVTLADADGKEHTPAGGPKCQAVVLFFLDTECPVSNGYAPTMIALAGKHKPDEVRVFGVISDPGTTAAAARKHAGEYKLPFPVLLDPRQALARPAGVRVVPEAVVLAPNGDVLYRGRIDDRYSTTGKRRDEPTAHDLADALTAVLAGKPPTVCETKAFGCPLPKPGK